MKKENIINLYDYTNGREANTSTVPAPISKELETAIEELIVKMRTGTRD